MIIFIELMKLTYETTTLMLKVNFHSKLKQRYFEFIKSFRSKSEDFISAKHQNIEVEHKAIATKLRQSEFFKKFYELNHEFSVENKTRFTQSEWNPIFFEDIIEKIQSKNKIPTPFHKTSFNQKVNLMDLYQSIIMKQKCRHLIILVHGYQGCRYDMRVVQNYIAKIIPFSYVLASQSNEDIDNKSIKQMGIDLAKEIKYFLNQHLEVSKISFIGHSLGGLLVREAIQHLSEFQSLMHSFMSLSSPHLGCRKNKSFLVGLGMKYLNKFKKDKIINQLQMDDTSKLHQSYLYLLAQNDKLFWFKNIILVSSPQDSYVPYTSARIEPKPPQTKSQTQKVIWQMAQNIWQKVNNESIIRLDIDIRSPQK